MQLELISFGRHKAEEVVVSGRLMFAKINGKWFALTHASMDPVYLRNREERANFAHAIGVPVKQVETYVRAEKRKAAKDALTEQLADARALLQSHDYSVIDPKDR